MGKERRLEKKIKKLEAAALNAEAAEQVADKVVSALAGAGAEVAVPEKKSRKRRAPKEEPDRQGPEAAEPTATVADQSSRAPVPSSVALAPAFEPVAPAPVVAPMLPTAPVSPVMLSEEAGAEPVLSAPVKEGAALTLERKVDILAEAVYDTLTDLTVQLTLTRQMIQQLVSEEVQKACEARLRKKRPRLVAAAGAAVAAAHSPTSTPSKRKFSGFQLFCQNRRQLKLGQSIPELARMWKETSELEKEQFKLEAERAYNAAVAAAVAAAADGGVAAAASGPEA